MAQQTAVFDEIRKFIDAERESRRSQTGVYDWRAATERRHARFSRKDLEAYFGRQKLEREMAMSKFYTAEEILQTMSKTNFLVEEEYWKFFNLLEMERRPFMPLGTSKGIGYSVSLAVDVLQPHFADTSAEAMPGRFDVKVLGVNFNVIPGPTPLTEEHEPDLSQERLQDYVVGAGITAAEKDDVDIGNGFCFAQLGHLGMCESSNWNETRQDLRAARNAYWTLPGYGVVLELDINSHPKGIWIIMDFFRGKMNEDDSLDCHPIDFGEAEKLLDGEGVGFTVAKIAESVEELLVPNAALREFSFNEIQTEEVQVVAAKRHEGYLLRQFVKREGPDSASKI